EVGPHDDVVVLACGRDAQGGLHRAQQGWGREVDACRDDGDAPLDTPSGRASTYGVERGSVLLARAPTGELVETSVVAARHDRTVKTQIELTLDDGRALQAPPALRFAIAGRAGALVPAARLAPGDALIATS